MGRAFRHLDAEAGLVARGDVEHLLALAGLGHHLALGDDEAAPEFRGHQELAAGDVDEDVEDVLILVHVALQADRLAVAAPAGELRGLQRVDAAAGGEDEELVDRLGLEGEAELVALLELEAGEVVGVALEGAHPALVGDHDGDRFALDHRHHDVGLIVLGGVGEGGAAAAERRLGAVFGRDAADRHRDDLPLLLLGGEQGADLFGLLGQLFELLADFEFLELAQVLQAHVEDGLGLHVGDGEALHQHGLGLILGADDVDDLVEVQIGDEETAEDLQPLLDLGEAVLRAANEHVLLVVEPLDENVLQAEHVGDRALGEHVHVEGDAALELGELEEALHQQGRVDVARLRHQDDANILGRFVAHVLEERHLLVVDEVGELLDQAGLGHLIRDLGDHHLPGAAPQILDRPTGAQAEAAATGAIALEDRGLRFDDDAAGGEIRAGDDLDQFLDRCLGRLDQLQRGLTDLVGIVRRDRGRHADGDAVGAVGQKIGEGAGQDRRFVFRTVVIGAEVDGVLVEALQNEDGDIGEAGLGVSHRGGVIAVDVAEVALAVDQRVALGEVLREADHGVVDRLIAVRMVLTDDVADDAGAFLEGRGRVEAQFAHGEEQAAMDRLQAVAHVRQGAVHDGRERIGEVALLERLAQIDRQHLAARPHPVIVAVALGRNHALSHDSGLTGGAMRGKVEDAPSTGDPAFAALSRRFPPHHRGRGHSDFRT